jgi:Outer membrane lipoprotein
MRTPIGYAILLAACLSGAQTSQELHSRYGEPDTERFKIRDGIALTVEYGSDGSACQMEIKPQQLLVQRPPEKLMAPEVVDGIIDEVVPPDTRGRKVDRYLERMGCAQHVVDYYENVTIGRSTDQCLPLKPERDTSVSIVFKRQACPDTGLQPAGPDAVLYKRGLRAVKENQCSVARTVFQTLINTYPNSEYATKAKMILKKPQILDCAFGES